MRFPVNSLYEISQDGKNPVLVQVVKSPDAFEKIRVRNVESGEEDYLVNFLKDTTEIFHIPAPGTDIGRKIKAHVPKAK